jgi:hypothetical protein
MAERQVSSSDDSYTQPVGYCAASEHKALKQKWSRYRDQQRLDFYGKSLLFGKLDPATRNAVASGALLPRRERGKGVCRSLCIVPASKDFFRAATSNIGHALSGSMYTFGDAGTLPYRLSRMPNSIRRVSSGWSSLSPMNIRLCRGS